METNTIFVKNYITFCSIGIYPNEKKKKQKIKISVNLDLKRVNTKDNITSTVSYENIILILKEIKNYQHINLLETLATIIIKKLEKINNVKKIKIQIIKSNILSGNQEVGVTLEKLIKNNQ